MVEELNDKELIAINKCIDAMQDFANYERWRVLDYLAARYGRTKHVRIGSATLPEEEG